MKSEVRMGKQIMGLQSYLVLITLAAVTHFPSSSGIPARKGNSNEEVLKELGVEIKMKGKYFYIFEVLCGAAL